MTPKMKSKIDELARAKQQTAKEWKKLSSKQKNDIEKAWDVEHAYYSATLEGNGLDRKKFDELAKTIK